MKRSVRLGPIGVVITLGVVLAFAGMVASNTPAQATSDGICDRSEQVRKAILAKLADVSACGDVTDSHLKGITDEIIILDHESLTLLDDDFKGLSKLETLYIHRNGLSSLPEDVFDGLSGLEKLYLYNNKLTTLPSDVFNDLTELEFLSLSYNSLTTLPSDVFDGLSDLETLNLNNNSLSDLPDDIFDDLTDLETLNLNSNSLEDVESTDFDSLDELNDLRLAGNDLGELPGTVFHGMPKLEILHLYSAGLSELPDGLFSGLENLNNLQLHSNSGSPFTVRAELELQCSFVVVKVPKGTPFDMSVVLSVEGGTLSTLTVEVAGGELESAAVTVTPDGEDDVTVSVSSATFQNGTYDGIQTGVGGSVTHTPWTPESSELTLSGISMTDYAENGTSAVATYAVADAGDSSLTWSLSGDDSGDFAISSGGVLTFISSPNYEARADADSDNVYQVTINASNGTIEGSLDVSVTVTDVDEGVSILGTSSETGGSLVTPVTVRSADEAPPVFRLSPREDEQSSEQQVTGSTDTDRAALNAFYNAMSGRRPSGWGSGSALSDWAGVTTNEDGRVTAVSLRFEVLKGTIAPELGNLDKLEKLDLSLNDFSGSIPPELGRLTNLTTLDLNFNETLTGAIPSELGKLTNLTTLDFRNNNLDGSIPPELGNMTDLETLRLSYNDLTGAIPCSLGKLANLEVFDLSSNDLTGSIPRTLGDLTVLEDLNLSSNDLSGSIPSQLGNLTDLLSLSLSSNLLTGSIPRELGDLTNLTKLYLDANNFTGCIPPELKYIRQSDLGALRARLDLPYCSE